MSYKIILLPFIILFTSATYSQTAKIYHLQSPDGKTEIEVSTGKNLSWSVKQGDTEILTPSELSLELSTGETLGHDARIKKVEVSKEDGIITTPFYKKGQVRDNYNQLKLSFKSDYALIFRAYNDGVAYRFITTQAGLIIKNEQAEFNFKDDDKAYLPFVNDFRNHSDPFNTSFEALYNVMPISAVKKDSLAFLPVLVDLGNNKKAVILEADIEDYPGMYLGAGNHGLKGVFAPYPIAEGLGGYHNINLIVNNRADYIAKSVAFKSYPWRVVIISNNDAELLNNDMVQRLASPSRVADISWIKPGKVAWDWWNDWNISHVNFKAGINDDTYKYYIDFASANKLEYIIIDEGWSSETDLTKISPALNLEKLVEYGKQKNVNIILWASWYAITRDLEGLMSKYEQLGIKGFKVDFIDRDDQPVTKSLYEIAAVAAKHHLLIDYHGMYKPSGMQRTFPNVINFEGVKGLENVKWGVKDHPVYDVTMPFIRMLAGPLDYTPGAMRNATKSAWRAIGSNPQSQGTRCHQLAMYTIFEAPLQMLADNPTAYKREQESTDFIAAVPTTFDETVAITGKVSEYACIARRKGTTWFAGAMTNWDDRTITVDLSFLGSGKYSATIFEDGINADHDATDYKRSVITVTSSDKLNIKMASGGGWSARFEKL